MLKVGTKSFLAPTPSVKPKLFTTKIDGFLSFNADVLFSMFLKSQVVYEQTQGSGAIPSLLCG